MKAVARALYAFAILAGCREDLARYDPCGRCSSLSLGLVDAATDAGGSNEVCYASCDDGDDPLLCVPYPRACLKTCGATTPCGEEGHPCIAYGGQMVCSYKCVSEACGPRRECRGFACQDVQCGTIVRCLGSSDICDVIGHRCYPFDGTCTVRADCPYYDEYWDTKGVVACTDGYCSIGVRSLGPPPGLPDVDRITIAEPTAGKTHLDDASVTFRWTKDRSYPNAATIVLVLDGYPQDSFDLASRAVWGAALPPGGDGPLAVADGRLIIDGTWTSQTGALPHNRLLTLVVQIVREGQLLADSSVVPFAVGHVFPLRGDPCSPALGPSACLSPMEAMSCDPVTDTCERVCGSYRDCLGIVPIRDCGLPRGNTRYCE